MAGRKKDPKDWAAVESMWRDPKYTIRQIAAKMGVTNAGVYFHAKQAGWGLKVRPAPLPKKVADYSEFEDGNDVVLVKATKKSPPKLEQRACMGCGILTSQNPCHRCGHPSTIYRIRLGKVKGATQQRVKVRATLDLSTVEILVPGYRTWKDQEIIDAIIDDPKVFLREAQWQLVRVK